MLKWWRRKRGIMFIHMGIVRVGRIIAILESRKEVYQVFFVMRMSKRGSLLNMDRF